MQKIPPTFFYPLFVVILTLSGGCSSPEVKTTPSVPPEQVEYDQAMRLYRTCQVRRRFVEDWVLHYYIKDSNGLAPYVQGLPGYGMFALLSDQRRNMADVNCCHGARFEGFGGWQAVNLPQSRWRTLEEAWKKAGESGGIPFAWCGQETGVDRRSLFSASIRGGSWTATFEGHVAEGELLRRLKKLNQILEGLGEKPVPVNVPDHVDWSTFKMTQKK